MDVKFPEGFYFGSATSAAQAEGAHTADHKAPDIWDLWFEEEPYKFHGASVQPTRRRSSSIGARISSCCTRRGRTPSAPRSAGRACCPTRRRPQPRGRRVLPQRVRHAARRGHRALREPVPLRHARRPAGARRLGKPRGRRPLRTLCPHCVRAVRRRRQALVHVQRAHRARGVRLSAAVHYPCKVDPKAAAQVAYHTALASALAVRACHEVLPDAKIGIVLNLTPAYPRSENPADARAAHIAELFANKSFLDPSVHALTIPSSSSSSRSTASCPWSTRPISHHPRQHGGLPGR